MSLTLETALRDDLLDAILGEGHIVQDWVSIECTDPRLLDNMMGTVFLMLPVGLTLYLLWSGMGWL